jgi:hypothetical protein
MGDDITEEPTIKSTPDFLVSIAERTESSMLHPPWAQSTAEIFIDGGNNGPNCPDVSSVSRTRFSKRTAILVRALIRERRHKLVQQVAVGGWWAEEHSETALSVGRRTVFGARPPVAAPFKLLN